MTQNDSNNDSYTMTQILEENEKHDVKHQE